MSRAMLKHWLRHPFRTFYWWYRMRGNIKLTVDIGKSLPIDSEMNRQQKLVVREMLNQYKVSDLVATDNQSQVEGESHE